MTYSSILYMNGMVFTSSISQEAKEIDFITKKGWESWDNIEDA